MADRHPTSGQYVPAVPPMGQRQIRNGHPRLPAAARPGPERKAEDSPKDCTVGPNHGDTGVDYPLGDTPPTPVEAWNRD